MSVILRASSVAKAFPEAKGVMVSSWCLCVVQVRKAIHVKDQAFFQNKPWPFRGMNYNTPVPPHRRAPPLCPCSPSSAFFGI